MRRPLKPTKSGEPHQRDPLLLGQVLGSVGPSSAGRARGVNATLWRQAVGHRIANRTAPTRLHGKTLLVSVASAAWAQELGLLSDQIVVRLQACGLNVNKVRFQVAQLPSAEPSQAKLAKLVKPAPLPEPLQQRIHQIEDTELRNAILEAAALWSGRSRAAGKSKLK